MYAALPTAHTCNNYTSTTAREHGNVKYTTTPFTPSTPHYTSPHLTVTTAHPPHPSHTSLSLPPSPTTAVPHYLPPACRTVSLTTRAPDEVNVETCFLFFALSVKRYRASGFSLKEREKGGREGERGREGGRVKVTYVC